MRLLYIGIAALIIIGAFFVIVRLGGSDEITGDVVAETAVDVATDATGGLKDIVTENKRLKEEIADLREALSNKASDFKEVVGLRKALDDVYEEKNSCLADLKDAEEQLEKAQARNRVLEKWVQACEDELGPLS